MLAPGCRQARMALASRGGNTPEKASQLNMAQTPSNSGWPVEDGSSTV